MAEAALVRLRWLLRVTKQKMCLGMSYYVSWLELVLKYNLEPSIFSDGPFEAKTDSDLDRQIRLLLRKFKPDDILRFVNSQVS